MTKATIAGQEYRIRFFYGTKPRSKNKKTGFKFGLAGIEKLHKKHIYTFCVISKKTDEMMCSSDPNKNRGWAEIAGDFVIRNPIDLFIKEEGRLLAFNRAVSQIKDRGIRVGLWRAYILRGNPKMAEASQKLVEGTFGLENQRFSGGERETLPPTGKAETFFGNIVKKCIDIIT